MTEERRVPFVRLDVTGTDDPMAGMSVVLYVAGCPRRCPGCQNPELQTVGDRPWLPVSLVIQRLDRCLNLTGVDGLVEAVVFQGGDWMLYPEAYCDVAMWAKQHGLRTVLYTGEVYERLPEAVRQVSDWVVDGPWDQARRAVFPPSSNQRVFRYGAVVDPEGLPIYRHLLESGSTGKAEQGGS